MKQEPFVMERVLNAPADRVWRALTNKDEMKEWYFDIPEFRPEWGFEFRFAGQGHKGEQYMHICRITEVVNGKKISYSWRYEGYPGASEVSFELFPEGDRTRLRLTHTGLESFPGDNPDFAKESFVQGWTEIIGSMLPSYVERTVIEHSVEINASPEKVWMALTGAEQTRRWAAAFSDGTYVETDWQKNSEVIWKDKDGNPGAKGKVEINRPSAQLRVSFWDDVNARATQPTGEYVENYVLTPHDGITTLNIQAGPLPPKHAKMHAPLWDKAMQKLKELAESD